MEKDFNVYPCSTCSARKGCISKNNCEDYLAYKKYRAGSVKKNKEWSKKSQDVNYKPSSCKNRSDFYE